MTNTQLAYTLKDYARFIADFRDAGYTFQGFSDLADRAVVIRHDVDLSPTRALRMARVEADFGVKTTYCFMLTTPAYNLQRHTALVDELQSLGHDVALHFDPHHYWEHRPGTETLEATVATEQDTYSRLLGIDTETVSFHMPPTWVLGESFDAFTNTYGPRYFTDIDYISDSQQKWRTVPPFETGRPDQVQILIHPGVWTPQNRRMDDIIADLKDTRHDRIDHYIDSFNPTLDNQPE